MLNPLMRQQISALDAQSQEAIKTLHSEVEAGDKIIQTMGEKMKKLDKLDKETTNAKKKLELTIAMSDQMAREATQAATVMSDTHFDFI